MVGFVLLGGLGLTRAMAGARFANFGSNIGSLAVYAFTGHIVVLAGLAMGAGAFSAPASAQTRPFAPARGSYAL